MHTNVPKRPKPSQSNKSLAQELGVMYSTAQVSTDTSDEADAN